MPCFVEINCVVGWCYALFLAWIGIVFRKEWILVLNFLRLRFYIVGFLVYLRWLGMYEFRRRMLLRVHFHFHSLLPYCINRKLGWLFIVFLLVYLCCLWFGVSLVHFLHRLSQSTLFHFGFRFWSCHVRLLLDWCWWRIRLNVLYEC